MKKIMLATDFSERSDRALRRAVILARAHDAVLDIVHVVDDDRPSRIVDHEVNDARQLLGELARSLKDLDGVSCSTQIVQDSPFAGIVRAVGEARPDLLVIGPHRRQILRDAFVGTTAERTIRAASCPVLMVNGPPVGPWRHVLQTTDLSDTSEKAFRCFIGLGLGAEARSSVLTVFDAPALRLAMSDSMGKEGEEDYLNTLRADARQALAEFMARLGCGQEEKVVRREEAAVATEILRAAEELKADLIVVATQGKGAIARMVLGSVAQQVLKDAQCDVLIIPHETA
ncbi:MAG: universal stress protein [Pseudotabrizicola sp.]|uniref:universal stress protein n=1 Tax=Pseudotabrizicola sp. TaxID=2939647 RepID=UPI00271B1A89|nr:universal stress protein [Pseudotabrizicola sp.]MDO8884676.1 universal stress protein [Pseudotabrizicola sp.]MDP2080183.1 universal stress protein [Pseudotabrizicola sp.]MDZ7572338.1 universal stress protein [Pseudotabrizicola sp.]